MGETRTYEGLTPGDYAGSIGGVETIITLAETVVTSDPAEMEFIEGVLGRQPVSIEVDENDGTFDSMTVAKLKEELEKRGLPTDGNKAELVTRLGAHERGEFPVSEEG